jgi:hypothetical protein
VHRFLTGFEQDEETPVKRGRAAMRKSGGITLNKEKRIP